jgi:hypothetical protein
VRNIFTPYPESSGYPDGIKCSQLAFGILVDFYGYESVIVIFGILGLASHTTGYGLVHYAPEEYPQLAAFVNRDNNSSAPILLDQSLLDSSMCLFDFSMDIYQPTGSISLEVLFGSRPWSSHWLSYK